MSGFTFCVGNCVACRRLFSFDPERVSSLTVNGQREPLCLECARRWRVIHNRPDVVIHEDAYL